MLIGSRLFVLLVFAILGLAFLAETLTLIWEFRDLDWFSLITQDSHNFLFFPTLGIVALAAFYVPASAFTDLYWRHVRLGPLRYGLGFAALAALAWIISGNIDASPYRSVWDLSPAALKADTSEPKGCGGAAKPCERLAILDAVANVRQVSKTRLGLGEFVRSCEADRLIEPASEPERRRFCFASTPLTPEPLLTTDAECCRAQVRLQAKITDTFADPANRSLTSRVHAVGLPLKVFFLLILGVISLMLVLRHKGIARHYPDVISRIDLGVLVGAAAMVFFPLMSEAFVETADALYGTLQNQGFRPIVPFMSFAFGAWALLLLMFFYRRHDREVEFAGKIGGVLASAIAIVKYDLIIALVNRFLGSGAGVAAIVILAGLSLAGAIALLSPMARRALEGQEDPEDIEPA